ncbi:MAG: hypothetical protein COB50_04500 [Thiotrichales bacterium]|nr:MAG: hypothetical protein COB50_04500 [Thiotrichales bacterium]
MLELDLIFETHLKYFYTNDSQDLQQKFRELLECNDQSLYNWLIARKESADDEHKIIVEKILSRSVT